MLVPPTASGKYSALPSPYAKNSFATLKNRSVDRAPKLFFAYGLGNALYAKNSFATLKNRSVDRSVLQRGEAVLRIQRVAQPVCEEQLRRAVDRSVLQRGEAVLRIRAGQRAVFPAGGRGHEHSLAGSADAAECLQRHREASSDAVVLRAHEL